MIKLKNTNKLILALLLVTAVFFGACEELEYKYSGPALASFTNGVAGGFYVENTGNSIDTIIVGVTTISGSARTINVGIDDTSTAISGTHYTLETNTVTIPANSSIGYVIVKGIYDGFTDPMDFKSLVLTIEPTTDIDAAQFDNQYVLALSQYSRITPWLGTYSVAAASYGDPGNWDEAWTVSTSADPDNSNNIIMTGIGGSSNPISAVLDVDAGTITIALNQDLGVAYPDDWPVSLTIAEATADFELTGEAVSGTISADGTINMDLFGLYAPDESDFWDVFNTTWTLQ